MPVNEWKKYPATYLLLGPVSYTHLLAGVIEPASADPVRIGDNVLVGANAVVIEGVQVGNGSVVAAGTS